MKRAKSGRFQRVVWLLGGALLLLPSQNALSSPTPTAPMKVELRGNDNRPPVFRQSYRNGIHFLVTGQRNPVKIFQEWCSWGYFTRWFSARPLDNVKTTFTIRRRSRLWTRNFPAVQRVAKGKTLITDIDLCDGTWIVSPTLAKRDMELSLTGHLEIKDSPEAREQGAWTGHVATPPIRVTLDPFCAAKLNEGSPSAGMP